MLKKEVILIALFACSVLSFNMVGAVAAANLTMPFNYQFSSPGTLHETGTMDGSGSAYWWVNSGAKIILSNGTGKTVQGDLSSTDKWRLIYLASNPLDTENGYHPQNVFRLLLRNKIQNVQQIAYFKVNNLQLSSSPNRDVHNALLLMSRYQNGDNLYYAGIRVDGNAIIKKKINGRYYTLASKKIFNGTYNRNTNPSLIPKNTWIGLKTEVKNIQGKATIKPYMDKERTGNWTLIAQATDDGSSYGPLLSSAGYTGIRTDFMDVEFDDYKVANI